MAQVKAHTRKTRRGMVRVKPHNRKSPKPEYGVHFFEYVSVASFPKPYAEIRSVVLDNFRDKASAKRYIEILRKNSIARETASLVSLPLSKDDWRTERAFLTKRGLSKAEALNEIKWQFDAKNIKFRTNKGE